MLGIVSSISRVCASASAVRESRLADLLVDASHLVLGCLGLIALARLHQRADRLGSLVAARLQRLDRADQLTTCGVQRQKAVDVPGRLA
jgi:hypothetical protein